MILGSKMSEESKRAISDKLKGILPSNFEKCIASNQFQIGHAVPEEWKVKISNKNKFNKFHWQGGVTNHQGYIRIQLPNHPQAKKGYVFEHRIVVENFIGRILLPSEVVHHLNEIKTDNRIENLMLFENNKAHMKFHTKLKQFGMTNPIRRQIASRWDNNI